MPSRAEQLFERGQSVWLDFIRRGHLQSGEFDALVREQGVVGVTSNPTIFQQAIADSADYDAGIRAGVERALAGPALFEALAVEDIQDACDRLRAVYERTRGVDGRVSIEVSPPLAHDTQGTIVEARRLHRAVARPNLYVKVPATSEGIPAIAALIAEGICINVTLIFSLARYDEVMGAYLDGLERRVKAGQPIAEIHSVASFFVSRVDAKVDKAIEERAGRLAADSPEREELLGYRGKTAVANTRLAYARFREVFGSSRFKALREKGANLQRPLWASTSTKNPAYPDTLYVDELVGRDTVNTMPLVTLQAVNDHGSTALRIEHDLPGAYALFDRLPKLGVALGELIGQLEPEGVASFAKSYDTLLATLETERRKLAAGPARPATTATAAAGATFTLGALATAVDARLMALERDGFAGRLWKKDDALWSDEPTHRAVAANRLGWLEAPGAMRAQAASLRAFAAEVAKDGYRRAVLLGMGGSSLAPEVLRLTLGVRSGALDLTVLDNTSPAAVRAVTESHDPADTLFVVASKSGGTIEVSSFERHFFDRAKAALGERAGRSFIAITDPGTALERLAKERGYRRTFTNPPDIGGRYSALSYFGLVPAALIGADLDALLGTAADEARANGPGVAAAQSPGLALGAVMGEAARAGRDKLTLVLSPGLEAFGGWVEQLVAESTGKNGRGIVPVAGEPLAAPDAYGADRLFVSISPGAPPADTTRALDALAAAGHPVLRWSLGWTAALGAEFLRWEIATAVAGAVLGVDPFDEPNVTEAKNATRAVLERYQRDGRFPARPAVAAAGGITVETPESIAKRLASRVHDGAEPAAWIAALGALARPGDYVALLAYVHATPARTQQLERLRLALRAQTRLATTLGIGPRFLHSTGQLHKGGPHSGLFVQLVADEGADLAIPGESYGFGALRDAQAIGDYEVLAKRERRVVRVHLGSDVERALERVIEGVQAAAKV
jgi:transaldolase/glucose-6-phosphate isomerase